MTSVPAKLSTDSENTIYDFQIDGSDYKLIHKRPPHPKLVLRKGEQIVLQILGGQKPSERSLQSQTTSRTLLIGQRQKPQKPLFSATPHPSLVFEIDGKPLQYTLTDPAVGESDRRIPILLLALFFIGGALVRIIPETVTIGMFFQALLKSSVHIAGAIVLAFAAWKSSDYPRIALGTTSLLATLDIIYSIAHLMNFLDTGHFLNPLNAFSFFLARFIIIYLLYHSIKFEFKRRITAL